MNEEALAPMKSWLVAPMGDEVSNAIRRLRRAPDVQRVAVMPDVHLAEDVCVGVAVATTELLYPQAVGGDIGCGMLAIPFDVEAASISEPRETHEAVCLWVHRKGPCEPGPVNRECLLERARAGRIL